jgi:steroid delta-isomerase-like uncharacterized protein
MREDRTSASRTELAEIARRWIAIWCVPPDWAVFDLLHAPDFEDCSSAGRGTDREAFRAGLERLIEAFPDLVARVDDLVVDEERQSVAVRWTAMGTNRATYLGVGPTGRRVTITGIEIVEIESGRIRRRWGEWDIGDHLRG